jgi:hypothetical protein
LEPIGFVDPTVTKFEGADPDIMALACGDLDGDGGSDLVSLTRQRLVRVRLRDGKVERIREALWNDLAPIAPVPMRQPLAFATIVEGSQGGDAGYLDAALSDRAGSVRLTPQLELKTRMQGKTVPHGRTTGCTWIAHLALGEKLLPCGEGLDAEPLALLGRQSDALDSTFLVRADGSGHLVYALRHDSALVVSGLGDDKVIGRVGAQLAIVDLDQDGAPEVATTIDVLSAKHDALEVRTLLDSGTVKRRYRVAVPSGVEALTACPPDSAGVAPLVLATRGELWVVR